MTNLPKVDPEYLCDVLKFCSLRIDERKNQYIAIKSADGTVVDHYAKDIVSLDLYQWVPVRRVYSSWHAFMSHDDSQIYLIQTTKRWRSQWQLTWWSPKEKSMKSAITLDDGEVKFDLQMVELNAETRTKARTWVSVTQVNNEFPTMDRVLMRHEAENTWEKQWILICLMHYRVKNYIGELNPKIWTEYVTWWRRFTYDEVLTHENIAPNVPLIMEYFRSQK